MSFAGLLSRRAARVAARLPAAALLALIRLYQRTLGPALPVVTLGRCACRYYPTCSHYAAEAIRTHGAWSGGALAAGRLVRCTPLHAGGFDPVPASKEPRRQSPKGPRDCPDLVLS
ncbi:MAG: membrane protein insertion efficiency factor YidD [Opitutaceae bacterium]|nr:membrane protein insertion efficiency factor YidD [Opitutaceae bacterium]